MRVYVLYSKKREKKNNFYEQEEERSQFNAIFWKTKKSELQFMRTIIKDTK